MTTVTWDTTNPNASTVSWYILSSYVLFVSIIDWFKPNHVAKSFEREQELFLD
jgi:hypothetical protein